MKIKFPSSIEENNLNFGIMTNHIMMLDDHNAKVQFFLSNFILLSASVVFFSILWGRWSDDHPQEN
jgi:hypothetical protein